MAVKLAPGELIIKSWNYGTTKRNRIKSDSSLTITTNRIISLNNSKKGTEYTDIPIKSVKSVSGAYGRRAVSIVLIVLAIYLILAGAAMGISISNLQGSINLTTVIPILIVITILAIGLIVTVISQARQSFFFLEVTTSGEEGAPFGIVMSATQCSGAFAKQRLGIVRIKVDRKAGEEIINSFNTIITELKDRT